MARARALDLLLEPLRCAKREPGEFYRQSRAAHGAATTEERRQNRKLSRAEISVTGVAQARDDVTVIVQLRIDRRRDDRDVRMLALKLFDAGGAGDDANELD